MAAYQYAYVMKDLTKAYPGGREVFKGITLSFLPDVKIGVLGPNGAGKPTLMRIMAGQDKEFGGEAWAAEGRPRRLPVSGAASRSGPDGGRERHARLPGHEGPPRPL